MFLPKPLVTQAPTQIAYTHKFLKSAGVTPVEEKRDYTALPSSVNTFLSAFCFSLQPLRPLHFSRAAHYTPPFWFVKRLLNLSSGLAPEASCLRRGADYTPLIQGVNNFVILLYGWHQRMAHPNHSH
jgi:hypothetical protein